MRKEIARSGAPELFAQFILCAYQYAAARRRKIGPGAIDIERQHRKRGSIRISFFATARLGGPLQRGRDALWIVQGKDASLKIQGVAILRYCC